MTKLGIMLHLPKPQASTTRVDCIKRIIKEVIKMLRGASLQGRRDRDDRGNCSEGLPQKWRFDYHDYHYPIGSNLMRRVLRDESPNPRAVEIGIRSMKLQRH